MKKFKYPFEKILRQKKIAEEQARRDFAEVQSKLDEQHGFLKNLELDLKNSYNDKYRLQSNGGTLLAR